MIQTALRGVLVLLLSVSPALWAQGDRGTVTGTVKDSTGAAVPGAQIIIVNIATNLTLETESSATGSYRFVGVPIGMYTLRATAPGFQTYIRENAQVQVNQSTLIDVEFQVGAVTETITVSGTTVPLISTESSDVGMVIESKRFLELPLTLGGSIRNPSEFIKLSPGVSPRSTWTKSISGGGAFQDMVYYDGIALSRGDLSNDAEVNPSVDAIAEFKLVTNNYSAEYSHALGGITSFTLKSGTNEVHGTGFYFIRNDRLDARGFFSPMKSPTRQNNWGGTIGGPLVLPKLYNGKDRTFWFFSWDQFYRRGDQLTGLNTLPTGMMQSGNFSELPNTIYDPNSTRVVNGVTMRDPFPNQVIPQNRWSRVSAAMLPYHPIPELPGVTANSLAPLASNFQDHRHTGGKFDHLFNSNHRMSFTLNFTDRPAQKSPGPSRLQPVGDTTALANWNIQRVTTRVAHLNFDSTISPTTLNHIGLGFSRFRNPNFSESFNQGWTQPDGGLLGLRGLQFDLFPTVLFDTEGYTRYGDDIASDNFFNTFTVLDTMTLIRGNHTLKIGFEVQHHQDNYRNFGNGGGTFRYIRNTTGNPASLANTGDAWASFLLGETYNSTAFFRDSLPGGRYTNYGYFIDDTWKVTSRLTLNLGFRVETIVPHSDPLGRLSYMDITQPNGAAGGRPGAMLFGGNNGFGNRMLNILWWNPAPRVGFAYNMGNGMVVRGGAGIFNSNYINQGLGLPAFGFSTTAAFVSGDGGLTPAFNWDNGFPQDFARPPVTGPTVANGQNVTAVLPDQYSLPYKLQWNLTIEKQFGDDLAFSGSYVANKGTHLYENQQLNQLLPQFESVPLEVLRANVNSPLAIQNGFSQPFPGFADLWGGRATVAQALRSFPQFNNAGIYGSTYGNSSYHSFQFKTDKRYRGGLSGTFAYTWSKFLTDSRQFDSFGGAQHAYLREKSYSVSDLPHMVTMSLMYQLPFGPGKKWASTGLAGKVAGGWSVATVNAYTSGDRISVSTNNTLPYFNPGLRPNQISPNVRSSVSMSEFDPASHQYLNREAFANPAPGTFGNAPRYLHVRGPARLTEQFAVLKDTRINERFNHQFRMEMQNPLNRTVFGNPVTNLAAGNFGRITGTAVGPRNIQFGMRLTF